MTADIPVIPKIIIDIRELPGHLPALLAERCAKHNVRLEIREMQIGDVILGDDARAERKEGEDFLKSLMVDRKLFRQLNDLRRSCKTPILIIEGKGHTNFQKPIKGVVQTDIRDAIFTMSGMNPVSLRGVLLAIQLDYGIQIMWTNSTEETAELLIHIAKREQTERKHCEYTDHASRKNMSLREQREYIISAIANIGAVKARRLLAKFRTVERFVTARPEEYEEVDKIGRKIAQHVKKIVSTDWEE